MQTEFPRPRHFGEGRGHRRTGLWLRIRSYLTLPGLHGESSESHAPGHEPVRPFNNRAEPFIT
jgi:hypothetical protein